MAYTPDGGEAGEERFGDATSRIRIIYKRSAQAGEPLRANGAARDRWALVGGASLDPASFFAIIQTRRHDDALALERPSPIGSWLGGPETMPLVSVTIAAYNNAAFLPETLDSIFAQTCSELEVIVVDDASHDDTTQRLEPYRGRILYQRSPENRGAAAAWNQALRRARGEFVALSAADDPWRPNRLARQLEVFHAHPEVGLVYGRMVSVDEERLPLRRRRRADRPLPKGWVFPDLFLRENFVSPTALIRREAIERVGLLDEEFRVAQDYEWYLRIAAAYPFGCVDAVLVEYRKHPGSVTTGKRHRAFPYQRKAIEKMWRLYPELIAREMYDRRRLHQYLKEARYYLRHGESRRARACLREALALRPARPDLLWHYARSFLPRSRTSAGADRSTRECAGRGVATPKERGAGGHA